MNSDEHYFRGQFNAQWPLQSSLLRRKSDDTALDIQTLTDRLSLTEEFLSELEKEQESIFGKKIDENSLLAVAQHFGFPTPLLDNSFSLKIAAFFATYDARNMKEDESVIGVIYYLRNYSDKEANALSDPGKHLGFSFFDATGINIGNMQILIPDIPDEDNRIHRQQGVFVSDFSWTDLAGISIDKIYFKQQKGLVFRDLHIGVHEDILLPDKTPISELADKVKKGHNAKKNYALLGNTKFYEGSVIGSTGSFLWAILNESNRFFEKTANFIVENFGEENLAIIKEIFEDYFQRVRLRKDVGDNKPLGTTFHPLAISVAKLAEWAKIEEPLLWEVARRGLEESFE